MPGDCPLADGVWEAFLISTNDKNRDQDLRTRIPAGGGKESQCDVSGEGARESCSRAYGRGVCTPREGGDFWRDSVHVVRIVFVKGKRWRRLGLRYTTLVCSLPRKPTT